MNLSFSEIVVNDVKGSQRKAFIEIKSIDHKNRSDAFYPYFFLLFLWKYDYFHGVVRHLFLDGFFQLFYRVAVCDQGL